MSVPTSTRSQFHTLLHLRFEMAEDATPLPRDLGLTVDQDPEVTALRLVDVQQIVPFDHPEEGIQIQNHHEGEGGDA